MNKQEMALKIGGLFLLRAILRGRRNRLRRRLPELPVGALGVKDLTPEQANAIHMEWEENDGFQDAELPHAMSAPYSDLSESEKAWIRGRFYHFVNMPAMVMRRWLRDPLVQDGTNKLHHAGLRARRHLRNVLFIKESTRRDGDGWRPFHYDVARGSIFVVQYLLHPRILDYPTWAILQNFGHDWTRTLLMKPQRRLPRNVERQIQAARSALKTRRVD